MQESDLDLIEKYILNLLDDKTKSEFEIRLKSDKALQRELDAYTLAIQSFRTSQKPDIRNHLIELENKIKRKETLIETVKYFLWSVLVIAIAFLMYKNFIGDQTHNVSNDLKKQGQEGIKAIESEGSSKMESIHMADSIKIMPKSQKKDAERNNNANKKLYAMYFKPYADHSLNTETRGGNYDVMDRYYDAYLSNNFEKTIIIFDSLSQVMQENDNILFIEAIALMGTKEMEDSGKKLTTIIRNNKSRYLMQAEWFLALNFLYKNQIEKSGNLLLQIKNSRNHPYQKNAEKLFEEIKI